MPIQPPHPPANVDAVPTPQDPPTLQDVTNAIKYVEEVKVGHRAFRPGCATAEDVAIAYTYRATVISARAGEAVAPPWFNEAMRSALEPLEDRMNAKMDQVKTDMTTKIDQVKADMTTKMDQIKADLTTKIDQVKADLNDVKVELREAARTTNAAYNVQCGNGQNLPYKIVRFVDGTSPNDRLPALYTAQAIRDLSARDVKKYMDGYGLPLNSENHKRAIANFIGCSVDL